MRLFARYRFSIPTPGLYLFLSLGLFSFPVYAVPNVVVSIPPVHSLVSAVMKGIAEPVLLIPGGQSPHSNSLKPSTIRQLAHADLLVWVGPDFELSLKKPVSLQRSMRVLTLINESGMHKLQLRESEAWKVDHFSHEHSNYSEPETTEVQNPDMHLWLSTGNAIEIARSTAQVLSEIDPENAQLYQRNSLQVVDKIRKTKHNIEQSLQPVTDISYLVFHDAYQYFENEFGLSPVGAVTLSPEQKPGIKTVLAIKQNVLQQDAKCIFHEPQFQPRLVARIAEETGIRTGELDPIGAALEPGPELWFQLMLSLRDNVLRCVGN